MSEAQQTITPERQIAASQVGAVFNSLHEYLRTLEPKDPENRSTMTHQLQCAHERVDEAAMWAIRSVLAYGVPPKPAPAAANDTTKDTTAADAAVPAVAGTATTSEPEGQPGGDSSVPDAPSGADALPPTTPTESV